MHHTKSEPQKITALFQLLMADSHVRQLKMSSFHKEASAEVGSDEIAILLCEMITYFETVMHRGTTLTQAMGMMLECKYYEQLHGYFQQPNSITKH